MSCEDGYLIKTDGSTKTNNRALYNLEYKSDFDCNDAYETGKIKAYLMSGTNLPTAYGGAAYVISMCNGLYWSSNKYIVQIAFDSGNNNDYSFYIRKHSANSWTSWTKWGGAT